MVGDLHVAVLLDPELPHDDVVDTAGRVCPRIRLIVSKKQTQKRKQEALFCLKSAFFSNATAEGSLLELVVLAAGKAGLSDHFVS